MKVNVLLWEAPEDFTYSLSFSSKPRYFQSNRTIEYEDVRKDSDESAGLSIFFANKFPKPGT